MHRSPPDLAALIHPSLAARAAADSAARRSFGKLVAILARRTSDIASAEDALADAFAAALSRWPDEGVPHNPEAWLLVAARRRVVDGARRAATVKRMEPHLALIDDERASTDTRSDDRLALMFACAHPAIDPGIRAPLILQTILGFDAATIASAFLVSPTTMAQRLARAKTKIRQTRIPFAVPDIGERASRLDGVLAAVYAAFSEGWSDPLGSEPRRRDLADEAIWLGRLVVDCLPDEPEAAGLLALMLYAEARRPARRTSDGHFVPLSEQDTRRWDRGMIEDAERLLRRAGIRGSVGRYQVEAAIQSAHAIRRETGHADWRAIERLYALLENMTRSPVVAVNRAAALAELQGPTVALDYLDAFAGDLRLRDYQPFWATRADLLARTGAVEAARGAYTRAIGLENDAAVRAFLQTRLSRLA